jgi:hypothetical protein
MTLRLFGCTCTMPTVPRPCGRAPALATTSCIRRVATCSASRRSAIGVGPACASMPVTVQSNQRMPSTPCTTPMVTSCVLQHRPLLDVHLEVRADRVAPGSSSPR